MPVCIICGGKGFLLHDGMCEECNGIGESDFDYDAIIVEDNPEDICPDEPLTSSDSDIKATKSHNNL